MDNLQYAVQHSYGFMVKEVTEILNMTIYSNEEKKRLFYACGTCLHWILDLCERVELSEDDKAYFSALRFANNMLKHDQNLLDLTTQEGGISFPIEFPIEIEGKEIRWNKLKDNGKYENQYDNYVKFLQDKSVIVTCEKAIKILLSSNSK